MDLRISVICSVLVLAFGADDVRVPPTITEGPERYYIFQTDATVILPCKASGIPVPTYTWTKNDHDLDKNINNIIWTPGEGTIKIVNAGSLDVGEYRCFASNQWGTAMSVKAELERATLGTYPVQAPIKPYNGDPGGPMKLTCDSIKSVPTPGYSWVIYEEAKGKEDPGKAVQRSKRVQMDDEGHLYFANLQSQDAEPGYIYKCNVYNPELQLTLGGSFSRITLSGGTGGFSPPLVQTKTPTPYIALRGKEAKLKCIFSGNPTPNISWKRQGASLPFGRYFIEDEGTTLKITDVEQGDEGRYLCDAENAQGQRTQEIDMKVEAEPVFVRDQDKPMSLNITEGGTAVFTCRADAIPAAVSQWYINGEKLDLNNNRPGPRREISEDGSTLTITNVCKNCINEGDHNTDLMNIQCEGTNDHNYAYADGFLNVFMPTVITTGPKDITMEWNEPITFQCEAMSDDATKVYFDWERDDVPIIYQPGRIEKLADNSLYIITENEDDSGKSFAGKYTCVATNGLDIVRASAELTLPPEEPPPVIKEGGMHNLWWIFLIIAIILLILILLFCCCLCIQKNKGDSYPVDEKERAQGNDPLKELRDNGYHDYQRPEDAPIKGSRASLSSTIKLDSDDEGSLNEYGDIDTGKFNEDGSFIGQYIEKDKKRPKDSEV
jgi:hypothetical protein